MIGNKNTWYETHCKKYERLIPARRRIQHMLVLVTYDVNTETAQGKRRLRNVAKECTKYGQRVQNSVFECEINSSQKLELTHNLLQIIDTEKDSLRFYNLGSKYSTKVSHYGRQIHHPMDEALII